MRDAAVRPAPRSLVFTALAGLMLAAGLTTALYTIVSVYRLHVVLPVWDEWASIDDVRRLQAGRYGLDDLAAQYNEHRLLVPRLFFFVDDLVFAMSGRFDLAVMFGFQAINAAILIGLMMRRVAEPGLRALLAGVVLLVLFSLRQEQNFSFGFQLQFTGVFAFAMLSAVAFVGALERFGTFGSAPRPGAWPWFGLAGLLGAASTFTMANGVLALPTLFVLALLVGAPGRVSLATAIAAAALAALYFHGYESRGLGLPLAAALANPLAYPRFLAALMGNVIGNDPPIPVTFGALGLAGAAAAAVRVARCRTRDPASATLLAIMGFMVASACATTYGRIGIGAEQALEGRYVEPSALFWCALVLFWIRRPPGRAPAAARLGVATALAAAIAILAAATGTAELRAWPAMVAQAANFEAFRDSLLSGLFDRTAFFRYEIFTEQDLDDPLAVLRAARLSLFGTPAAAEAGRPIDDVGTSAAGACSGSVAASAEPESLGAGGARLSGTAWDDPANRPVRRILVAGADGRVAGFGSLDKPSEGSRRWTGVAKARPGEHVAAYAVRGDGSVCDLGRAEVR